MNVERLTIPSYPPLTKGRNTIVLPLGKGEVEGDEGFYIQLLKTHRLAILNGAFTTDKRQGY